MKNKTKKFLLGFGVGFLTLGVAASFGSLLNNQNKWFDNLVDKKDYYMGFSVEDLEYGIYTEDFTIGGITVHCNEEKYIEVESVDNGTIKDFYTKLNINVSRKMDFIGKSSFYYNVEDVDDLFDFRCITFEIDRVSKMYCPFFIGHLIRYDFDKNGDYIIHEDDFLNFYLYDANDDYCFLSSGNYALVFDDLENFYNLEIYD